MQTHAMPRPRRVPRPPRNAWQRLPFTIRYVVPLLLLGSAALGGFRLWQQNHVTVRFVGVGDGVPELQLTVFPEQSAYLTPSPPPRLGEIALPAGRSASVTLGSDLVPQRAVVQYAGAGIGSGYLHVELGQPAAAVQLQPAETVMGAVTQQWSEQPVVGARVIAMGGGSHGIPLAETRTTADGSFRLTGFCRGTQGFAVRVLAPGCAVLDHDLPPEAATEPLRLELAATRPVVGRVVLPPGLASDGLRVLARGLPGVDTAIAADGSFELDHVPEGVSPRLLVYGLPDGFTHDLVRAAAGHRDVRIGVAAAATVRGRVVDGATNTYLAGALVYHLNGPQGMVVTETGPDGSFALGALPPGASVITAQVSIPGAPKDGQGPKNRTGEHLLTIVPGTQPDEIMIRID